MNMKISRCLILILVFCAILVPTGAANAATFIVNDPADTLDVNPGDGLCADAAGNCTLRAAIGEANALAGPDTIELPAGTYTLTLPGATDDANLSGDLDISGDLTINGAGAATTIVEAGPIAGSGIDRVFEIHSGTVVFNGITIRHGQAPAGAPGANGADGGPGSNGQNGSSGNMGSNGGGIANSGVLTLNDSIVTANRTGNGGDGGNGGNGGNSSVGGAGNGGRGGGGGNGGNGGGIYNSGTLTLNNSAVLDNHAAPGGNGGNGGNGGDSPSSGGNGGNGGNGAVGGRGGAIYNTGNLTLFNTTLGNNSSGNGGNGGAGGNMGLNGSSGGNGGNGNSGGSGGAVYNTGLATISYTTIYNNAAATGGTGGTPGTGGAANGGNGGNGGTGGAIYNGNTDSAGTVTVLNSTLSGNSAGHGGQPGPGGAGSAGGNGGGSITTRNDGTTFNYTTVAYNAAGLGSGGSSNGRGANLYRGLIENSLVAYGVNATNCTEVSNTGINLASDNSCGVSIPNTDPALQPLADNGGPTKTHAFLVSSPAYNVIPGGTAGCGTTVTNDQRGEARPQDLNCDVGAFELITDPTAITLRQFQATSSAPAGVLLLVGALFLGVVSGVLAGRSRG